MLELIQTGRLAVLVFMLGFILITLIIMRLVKKGMPVEIRKIAAFEAIPEAIGRSAELGRPVIFPGGFVAGMVRPERAASMLASLTLLGYITELACKYKVHLITTNVQPDTHVMCDAIVKEKYLKMGVPPQTADVRFLTNDQFAYSSAVVGIMNRENVGASFALGPWGAEALIITEGGASVGAFQIGGEGSTVMQIPSLIASCDFMLIGEEIYAAAASVSKLPEELGGLQSQSVIKVVVIFFVIAGAILVTLGNKSLLDLLAR